jgi:hypothetical protein
MLDFITLVLHKSECTLGCNSLLFIPSVLRCMLKPSAEYDVNGLSKITSKFELLLLTLLRLHYEGWQIKKLEIIMNNMFLRIDTFQIYVNLLVFVESVSDEIGCTSRSFNDHNRSSFRNGSCRCLQCLNTSFKNEQYELSIIWRWNKSNSKFAGEQKIVIFLLLVWIEKESDRSRKTYSQL